MPIATDGKNLHLEAVSAAIFGWNIYLGHSFFASVDGGNGDTMVHLQVCDFYHQQTVKHNRQ